MELKQPKEWVSSMDLPTVLMITLSVITVVFTVIIARYSYSSGLTDLLNRARDLIR